MLSSYNHKIESAPSSACKNKVKSTTIWKPYNLDAEDLEIKKNRERALAAQFQSICKIFDSSDSPPAAKCVRRVKSDFPKRHNLGVLFVTQPKNRSRSSAKQKELMMKFSAQTITMNECRDATSSLKSARNSRTDLGMKSTTRMSGIRKRHIRRGKSATRGGSSRAPSARNNANPRRISSRAGSCPPQIHMEAAFTCAY